MFWTNQRTHVRRRIAARTKPESFRFFNTKSDESLGCGLLDKQPLYGEADLSTVRIAPPYGSAGGHLQVRIRQNDHGIFAAKFEHGGDQPFCASLGNASTRGHAAREHDFVRRG